MTGPVLEYPAYQEWSRGYNHDPVTEPIPVIRPAQQGRPSDGERAMRIWMGIGALLALTCVTMAIIALVTYQSPYIR